MAAQVTPGSLRRLAEEYLQLFMNKEISKLMQGLFFSFAAVSSFLLSLHLSPLSLSPSLGLTEGRRDDPVSAGADARARTPPRLLLPSFVSSIQIYVSSSRRRQANGVFLRCVRPTSRQVLKAYLDFQLNYVGPPVEEIGIAVMRSQQTFTTTDGWTVGLISGSLGPLLLPLLCFFFLPPRHVVLSFCIIYQLRRL
jgi:hypothetical protein